MTHYFVEYLPRLKTTTVQIEIPREKVQSVEIKNDSILINSNLTIKLPNEVKAAQTSPTITAATSGATSLRIRDNQVGFLANDSVESLLQDQYQWNVDNIQKYHMGDAVKCSNCGCLVIDLKQVKKLLPMPSELWYEMLDFWHCHKPTVENSSIGLLKKFNQLKPNPKNMIIGSYYFIINPEDWADIEIYGEENSLVRCRSCHELLGELDSNIGSYKLLKWQLEVGNEQFKPYSYISLKLVEEMNYSAVRVFRVVDEKSKRSLQVWCFGLGIDVNSDTLGVMKNCLKILYRDDAFEDHKEGGNNGEILIEYAKPFDDFHEWLSKINRSLPENLREYNGWRISYIPMQQ